MLTATRASTTCGRSRPPTAASRSSATSRGPAGAPTVLLYSHYDVQPAGDPAAWRSPPWALTERDGRWYARGAADCKGNLVMLLTALRALPARGGGRSASGWSARGRRRCRPGGLERLVRSEPVAVRRRRHVVADAGNVELGTPTVTTSLRGTGSVLVTVETLAGPVHSGDVRRCGARRAGRADPDAGDAARRRRRDDGRRGDVRRGRGPAPHYPVERFRADAGVLDGVDVSARGTVADALWARPVGRRCWPSRARRSRA